MAVVAMKQVIARSRVVYRGVIIWETRSGNCAFFIGFSKFEKATLQEATDFIDEAFGSSRVS